MIGRTRRKGKANSKVPETFEEFEEQAKEYITEQLEDFQNSCLNELRERFDEFVKKNALHSPRTEEKDNEEAGNLSEELSKAKRNASKSPKKKTTKSPKARSPDSTKGSSPVSKGSITDWLHAPQEVLISNMESFFAKHDYKAQAMIDLKGSTKGQYAKILTKGSLDRYWELKYGEELPGNGHTEDIISESISRLGKGTKKARVAKKGSKIKEQEEEEEEERAAKDDTEKESEEPEDDSEKNTPPKKRKNKEGDQSLKKKVKITPKKKSSSDEKDTTKSPIKLDWLTVPKEDLILNMEEFFLKNGHNPQAMIDLKGSTKGQYSKILTKASLERYWQVKYEGEDLPGNRHTEDIIKQSVIRLQDPNSVKPENGDATPKKKTKSPKKGSEVKEEEEEEGGNQSKKSRKSKKEIEEIEEN